MGDESSFYYRSAPCAVKYIDWITICSDPASRHFGAKMHLALFAALNCMNRVDADIQAPPPGAIDKKFTFSISFLYETDNI